MSERGIGIGPVGIFLALVGVLASYMACLYGIELEQQSLVAFGVWSIASLLIAFVVDFLFKYVMVLAVLFVAALGFTDNPAFQSAAAQAKILHSALCAKIPFDNPDVPVKDWIC